MQVQKGPCVYMHVVREQHNDPLCYVTILLLTWFRRVNYLLHVYGEFSPRAGFQPRLTTFCLPMHIYL
jgi:hypothetical protein